MYLYNITLGNLNLTPEPWSHMVDDHGNHFIAKDDIRQRIRIDNRIDSAIYPELGALTPVWHASNMQCYNLLPNTKWVNNNRNMNPMVLENKDSDNKSEQIVVYITVSNNYAIARFNTHHRILQTYHKKDLLQGCAVVLNAEDRESDPKVIGISAYDKKKDQFIQFNIYFSRDDLNKITIERKNINNKEVIDTLKTKITKNVNRYMGFKILTGRNELLTLAYVTTEKYKNEIINATKDIKNPLIITVDTDVNSPKSIDKLVAQLGNEFNDNRIRAVTQYGVNLPLEVIRRLKLLYVFNYDNVNNALSCRKSN